MIYFDNNATTKVDKKVLDEMLPYLEGDFANPSSMYDFAKKPAAAIKEARGKIRDFMGAANEKEIFFTSGGTESNNWALIGSAFANKRAGKHIITTSIEHASVLNPMHYLEENGFEVTYLNVDKNGKLIQLN